MDSLSQTLKTGVTTRMTEFDFCRFLSFCNSQKGVFPDLLATSGDYLRVWRAGDSDTRLECLLNNVSDGRKITKSSKELYELCQYADNMNNQDKFSSVRSSNHCAFFSFKLLKNGFHLFAFFLSNC